MLWVWPDTSANAATAAAASRVPDGNDLLRVEEGYQQQLPPTAKGNGDAYGNGTNGRENVAAAGQAAGNACGDLRPG